MSCCRDGSTLTLEDSKYFNPVCTSLCCLLISWSASHPNLTFSSVVLLAPSPLTNLRSRTFPLWLQTMWAATVWLLQPLLVWRASLVCTSLSSYHLERWKSNQRNQQSSHKPHKPSLIMTVRAACSSGHYLSSKWLYWTTFQLHAFEWLSYFECCMSIAFFAFPLHSLHILIVHIVLLYRGTLWHYKGLSLRFYGER